MKQGGKQENKEQEWRTEIGRGKTQEKTEQRIREETEEEEQYMTIGEDGRPHIAVKIRQRDENMDTKGAKTTNTREEERNKMWDEEEVTKEIGGKIKELQCRDSSVGK